MVRIFLRLLPLFCPGQQRLNISLTQKAILPILKENYMYLKQFEQLEELHMSNYDFTKKDWILFREKVPGWQLAYMDKLNKEYIELLSGPESADDKFWALEERIRHDKKKTGVLINMTRSNCIYNIVSLINEGAITMADLDDFSDLLKESVSRFFLR